MIEALKGPDKQIPSRRVLVIGDSVDAAQTIVVLLEMQGHVLIYGRLQRLRRPN